MGVAVRCEQLEKSYVFEGDRTQALRGVDLDVHEGEMLMLVGPSGCGKTTLISVVAGILGHDRGRCEVYGTDLNTLSDSDRTRFRGKNIGFVFQAYNLIPTLSIAENVAIPLLLNGVPRVTAVQRAEAILERVGLGAKIRVFPSQLSGGQQQRVAIARALVHEPRLIVCDEPTSALDQKTGHHIMELFCEVALQDSRTLLVVTHDSRIFQFADRIALMNDGKVEKVVHSPSELENHEERKGV